MIRPSGDDAVHAPESAIRSGSSRPVGSASERDRPVPRTIDRDAGGTLEERGADRSTDRVDVAPRPAAADRLASRCRVLVADDDPAMRATLVALMISLGHEVVGGPAGRPMLDQVRAFQPDAVLLGARSPGAAAAAQVIAEAGTGIAVVLYGDASGVSSDGDGDMSKSGAIAFLPSHAPRNAFDSTVRLGVSRMRDLSLFRREAGEARQELATRKLVERAKGILMRRTRLHVADVERLLERESEQSGAPMLEVARSVVESELPAMRRGA